MNSINSIQLSQYMTQNSNINQYVDNNTDANINKNIPKIEDSSGGNEINNQAVNVSISMQSMLVYVHVRSLEFVQSNTKAQDMLHNIFNNKDVFDFLDGRKSSGGLDLKATGYNGKPITQLTADEAKNLVSKDGFFGVDKTSDRVSNFVFGISGDDVELLKESRNGLVKGFDEAEKLWGGKLPDISYETQQKTLEKVDKRIAELLNKDKKVDDTNSELGKTPAKALEDESSKADASEDKNSKES